jgi:drug/metabolite transporter (DMT)-like permease
MPRMATDRGRPVDWLVFLALGLMWGSSYLFIRFGLDTLTPFTLVALRLAIGGAVLWAVLLVAREPLPRERRTYANLGLLSLFSILIPFSLITWAELAVPSSLAAILTAPVPLFTIVIAGFALRDEPITLNRVVGLVIGFVGVAVITGGSLAGLGENLLPQLALLGAAASYAVGGVIARRTTTHLRPMVPAAFQVLFGFVMASVLAFTFERPLALEYTAEAVASVLWLGILGSGLAYLAFFRLSTAWGATRTSLVAYVLPVVGIALGVVFAGEVVDLRTLLGAALVIGGVALVNARIGQRRVFVRRRQPVPGDAG